MSTGRSKLYDRGDVAEYGDVAAVPVAARRHAKSDGYDLIAAELDTLKTINAHLVRQLACLRQREAQAQKLADRDGLTGLYNRRRMFDLLESSLIEAQQRDHKVGLLFIDLDGFKGVNDGFGHGIGDKLLTMVAGRLAARARTGDFVCRYGGDEFVVILPSVRDMAAVNRIADSIRVRVALPYLIDGFDLNITSAVGVSIYPDEARNAAALMSLADESMYREKGRGAGFEVSRQRTSAPARRRHDKPKRRLGP